MKQILQADSPDNRILQLFAESEDLHKVMGKAGFSSLEQFGHAPYLYYPVMPRAGFIAAKS